MEYKLPVVIVLKGVKRGSILRTTLRIDQPLNPPVAPASLWINPNNKENVIDLHALVKREGSLLTFETYNEKVSLPKVRSKYNFISWWRPDQLEVAQDISRTWRKQQFSPKDAVEFKWGKWRFRRQLKDGEIA